jgi:tetratricopeptide (TPR) repeat protein
MGFPLLLRSGVTARTSLMRGAAIGVIPALSAAIFLTSSRGAIAAALVGTGGLLWLTRPRAVAVWAMACAGAGSLILVALLSARGELVNRPLQALQSAAAQGRSFAVIALAGCVMVGAVFAVGIHAARARGVENPLPSLGPAAKVGLASAAALAVIAAVIVANPDRLVESFKQTDTGGAGQASTTSHLGSAAGGGRYQFWSAAVDQFEANPILGDGAGAYQAWWAAHPRFPYFIKDAHSLYLETLGELGVVGFALLIAMLGYGLATGLKRLRGSGGSQRATIASLGAAVIAWAFAAGIDWMWEMPVVSGVAIVSLGLLTGPATAGTSIAQERPEPARVRVRRGSRSFGLGVAVIAIAWLVVCAQASPLLSQLRLDASEAALARRDYGAALGAARGARTLQPWAPSPYEQLALVEERRGRLPDAHRYIEAALAREPSDFVLWEDAARIETAAGKAVEARESLARARDLNPRLTVAATVAP